MAVSFISGVAFALIGYFAYTICLVVYRLYLHPLAKFPGPRAAAATRWPEFYYEVIQKGQFSKVIDQYHEIYGK